MKALAIGGNERSELKRYAEAIAMWNARFDTHEIAQQLRLPECTIARWVANFRDLVRAT
jgi:hypothetical protein